MTAREIYDLALRGGGNDFQATVELLERLGEPWCLIGGLAVNAYAEPVYTADADMYGFDIEGERRREAEFKDEIRRRWCSGHSRKTRGRASWRVGFIHKNGKYAQMR
jgi:hypothetical protein